MAKAKGPKKVVSMQSRRQKRSTGKSAMPLGSNQHKMGTSMNPGMPSAGMGKMMM